MSNDRLKFRAWDYCGHMREWEEVRPQIIFCFENYEVMQWTGLYDCEGVEIYEGDIVETRLNSHYWVYLVTTSVNQFGNMLFAIEQYNNCSIDEESDRYTFEKTDENKGRRSYVPSGKWAEIIGNIYENPELIDNG